MKKLFGFFVLLMCSGLILMPQVQAAERRATRIQLQSQVEQLKKSLREQTALAEQERYAHADRVLHGLENKCNQTDQSKKFTPYTYP